MTVSIGCVAAIQFPSAQNRLIGYCYEHPETKEWLSDELERLDCFLEFRLYTDQEQLHQDIRSGLVDSGFILPGDIHGDAKVQCVYTPMSTKAALAKLTIFCACYRIRSESVILAADEVVYGDSNEQRQLLLLQKNKEIASGDRVFDVEMKEVPTDRLPNDKKSTKRLPVQGIAGIFVMLNMLLANGFIYDQKSNRMMHALSSLQRKRMCMIHSLAAAFLPVLVVIVMIQALGCSRGFVTELLAMLSLILWTQIWMRFGERLHRDAEYYYVDVVLFLLMQLVMCSVFFDVAEYLNVLRVIRLFSPLGIYLFY